MIAEISYGLARLAKSKRRSLLEERIGMIAATFERLEWTDAVSTAFGEIKAQLGAAEVRRKPTRFPSVAALPLI